jgi:glycosyltransferase involved in cell wall biosynthesis
MGISAVIITKNESKYIKMCLESLKFAGEIIIIDDFSSDKTIDIARDFTDKIYQRHLDNFAAQRNFGIEKAKGEWILSLDGDEVVSEELAEELSLINKNTNIIQKGFYVPFRQYFFGKEIKYGGWHPDYHMRFFRKGWGRWEKPVHEELVIKGKTGRLEGHLIHYLYENISEFINKINFYTSKDVEEGNVDGNILKTFLAPPKVFLYRYIFRQGFRDGRYGLIIALFMSFYVLILRLKKWEKQF